MRTIKAFWKTICFIEHCHWCTMHRSQPCADGCDRYWCLGKESYRICGKIYNNVFVKMIWCLSSWGLLKEHCAISMMSSHKKITSVKFFGSLVVSSEKNASYLNYGFNVFIHGEVYHPAQWSRQCRESWLLNPCEIFTYSVQRGRSMGILALCQNSAEEMNISRNLVKTCDFNNTFLFVENHESTS